MPDEAMTNDGHAVFFAEMHQLICIGKVESVFFRMDGGTLHAILCYDGIEVLLDEPGCLLIPSVNLAGVEGDSHQEVSFNGPF